MDKQQKQQEIAEAFKNFDWGEFLFETVLENALFFLGALLMYAKTSELLTRFAPKELFGYIGVESFFGSMSALMVEGVFVLTKFRIGRSKNPLSFVWNIVLIIVPFVISALCQVFDNFFTMETLAQQPEEIRLLISWGVPLVPALIVSMVLAKSVFENLPADVLAGFLKKKNKGEEVKKV